MRRIVLALALLLAGNTLSCLSDNRETVRVTQVDTALSLPALLPPAQYGNVLISRLTLSSTHPPVAFSHWVHRRRYTCRVCHGELNFAMQTNTTDMNDAKIRKGEYCGACHNGRIAFGISEQTCRICHTGNIGSSDARFKELQGFPKARYGDQINWVEALQNGLIKPKQSIFDPDFVPIPFEKDLRLDLDFRTGKTHAIFPHQKHTEWLDCADCHPDIFSIRKKGTKYVRMDAIKKGLFCGVCHLSVAFPIQDCKRCHPDLN